MEAESQANPSGPAPKVSRLYTGTIAFTGLRNRFMLKNRIMVVSSSLRPKQKRMPSHVSDAKEPAESFLVVRSEAGNRTMASMSAESKNATLSTSRATPVPTAATTAPPPRLRSDQRTLLQYQPPVPPAHGRIRGVDQASAHGRMRPITSESTYWPSRKAFIRFRPSTTKPKDS